MTIADLEIQPATEEQQAFAALNGTLKACTVCKLGFEAYWMRSFLFKDQIKWPVRCMKCEIQFVFNHLTYSFEFYYKEIQKAIRREAAGASQCVPEKLKQR